MPLTDLQLRILRVVSANRSPDNYVAGGSALNTIYRESSGNRILS